MSNEEIKHSTSEQESTKCSSSQGSSGEVEERRKEEISGAIEEVVNNRSHDFRMESLTTNSEVYISSNVVSGSCNNTLFILSILPRFEVLDVHFALRSQMGYGH